MVQPGEGERRAAIGLHAQYDIAAELTLANMRDLEWVKVADPQAGKADDFQLATTTNQLHALQVRWSTFPSPYGFGKLADGAYPLICDLAEAWSRLREGNPGRAIRVHLVSNNIPASSQTIQKQSGDIPGHFAAFIARGLRPLQRILRQDPTVDVQGVRGFADWAAVWERLQSASALDDGLFWNFITDLDLNLGVSEQAFPETDRRTPAQKADLSDLSSLFFEIVSDPGLVVKLSRAELLERLGWTSRLSFRNPHVFPVPAAYEPNEQAVSDLLAAIESHAGGYLGLVAPAGAGKSTLLTATELPARQVVHYYAYTPEAPDPSTGRGESENFFFDIVTALDAQGLYTRDVVDPRDRLDLKARFLRQLEEAGDLWKEKSERTVIVVDGLDHIPREQSPTRSLIDDLPDPGQLPDGVFIIIGTQALDVLPVSIKTSLSANNRTIALPPLNQDTVLTVASSAGPGKWLQPEQKQALVGTAEGHPLALTYLLEELSGIFVDPDRGPTAEAYERANAILEEGAEYKGDIEARYEGYWHRIAGHSDLHHLLGITVRLRSRISLEWLITWNNAEVVHRFAETAAPFFVRDGDSWAFIHNSFRLFLRRKTATVGDTFSDERHRSLHAEAAEICAAAQGRWVSYRDEELAQRLHAEQHERVLDLAASDALRARLNSFAPPAAVRSDVDLALRSAAMLGDAKAVLRLALVKFELDLRNYVLEPHDIAMSLINLGEYETALKHVVVGRELRINASKALEAAVRLADAGRFADCGEIVRAVGSLRSLLERKDARRTYDSDAANLIQWWVAVHVRVRPLEEVLDELNRELPAGPPDAAQDDAEEADSGAYRRAALWQLSAEAAHINDAAARAKIMLAVSEMDPVAAASAELAIQTDGSLDATLERIDAALVHFDVGANNHDPKRWARDKIEKVPARIRIIGAELLVAGGVAADAAKTLITGCRLAEARHHGDEEERRLWRAYRLHRLRHFVGFVDEPDAFEGTDSGLARFTSALRELAELDASVGRIGGAGEPFPGPVMSVVRRLHRLYEIPWRQRQRWRSWYIAQGAAPAFFKKLIEVAANADEDLVPTLWELFLGAWNDPTRSDYWSYKSRIAVVRALGQRGISAHKVVAELETIRAAVERDKLEVHERIEALLKLAAALGTFGARDRAVETLRAAVEGSFVAGVHDEDYQLKEWVLRFGEWVEATREGAKEHRRAAIAMAQRLAGARAAGTSTGSPARNLVRLTFGIDPGLAVDMRGWFQEMGVLDGPEGLAGLIEGAAEDDKMPPKLVAEMVRSIYMPCSLRALPTAAARLVERGGETVRLQITDGIRRWVLPTFRARWGKTISKDASPAPTPWIGAPPAPQKDDHASSEPAAVVLEDGSRLSEEDAAERVSSKKELIDLLNRTAEPSESHRFTPLGAATRKAASDVGPADIDTLIDGFRRVRSDWASYSSLAAELIKRRDIESAEKVIREARRCITMRGWSGFWDGGTRRKFWAEIVESDGVEWVREAAADLATSLRVDAVQLSALVHELPRVLPIIGLSMQDAWPVIDNYLEALCRPMGFSRWEPGERDESGTAALLRYTATLAGHPVRPLEWGARAVLRQALSDPNTVVDCAKAIVGAVGDDEAVDEALFAVLAIADRIPSEALEILEDGVKLSARSPDQIVRDVGQRAAHNLGINLEARAKRPLPLSYTLTVPPLPPRGAPLIDEEGVAVLDPLNPRSHLGTYDDLLENQVAEYSELDPAVLVRQGARLADEYAERGRWTRGGVQAHAQRIKAAGWLHGYRPWALMVGRRGAAAVIAQLADARVFPDPSPFTLSERLEMIDPELESREPEALPNGVTRPARRDKWGADSGDWIGDTTEAARAYETAGHGENLLGESMTWTEFSWNLGRERRVTVVRRRPAGGTPEVVGEPRPGVVKELEKGLHRSTFNSAARYRLYAQDRSRNVDPAKIPLVVGGQDWWAELRWGEWLALNPDVGLVLGWQLTDRGLFEWIDETTGEQMARSRWWTQGLETHHPPHFEDDAGEGWQVIVTPRGLDKIVDRFGSLERWSAVARALKNAEELRGDVLTIREIPSP